MGYGDVARLCMGQGLDFVWGRDVARLCMGQGLDFVFLQGDNELCVEVPNWDVDRVVSVVARLDYPPARCFGRRQARTYRSHCPTVEYHQGPDTNMSITT